MRVRLIVSRSGVDGAFAPGDEIEVADAEALRMIEAGQCTPVREARAPEKAVRRQPRPETAARTAKG